MSPINCMVSSGHWRSWPLRDV
uniref:Uncharacterized protein n=1 Tax=Anguilla anguilla TaxID=7936 RepID=A0A0E9TWJ1_ANGAN